VKHTVFVLLLSALLLLTACGVPVSEPAPVEEEPVAEEVIVEEPVAEEEVLPEEPAGPTAEDALAFVDQPLSALVEALGEPLESYYEYSCSGPGDDGILTYDGFLVFTYREPDGVTEVVIDAEAE